MTIPDYERPLYRQVADHLRERILCGDLAPGAPLPGEDELRIEFGGSRTSVRKAVDVLLAEGLLTVDRTAGGRLRTVVSRRDIGPLLFPGDTVASVGPICVTRAGGEFDLYPAGAELKAAGSGGHPAYR